MAHTISHTFWKDTAKKKPKKQRLGCANEHSNHADFVTLILVGIIMLFTWTLIMVSQRDMEIRIEKKIDAILAKQAVVKKNVLPDIPWIIKAK